MRNNGLTSVKHTETSNSSFTWESNQDRKCILLSPTNLKLLTYHWIPVLPNPVKLNINSQTYDVGGRLSSDLWVDLSEDADLLAAPWLERWPELEVVLQTNQK